MIHIRLLDQTDISLVCRGSLLAGILSTTDLSELHS